MDDLVVVRNEVSLVLLVLSLFPPFSMLFVLFSICGMTEWGNESVNRSTDQSICQPINLDPSSKTAIALHPNLLIFMTASTSMLNVDFRSKAEPRNEPCIRINRRLLSQVASKKVERPSPTAIVTEHSQKLTLSPSSFPPFPASQSPPPSPPS